MQDKVVFKLDVSDERVKRRAMKVVCDFLGVTLIDVKEKGKLKVTGEFNKHEMTKKLKKVYEFVDIMEVVPGVEPSKNQNQVKKPEPKVKKPEPKVKKPESKVKKPEPKVKKPEPKVKKTPSYRGWKLGFF